MTITFNINDILIPNDAYVETLSKKSGKLLKQAVQILKGLRSEPAQVKALGNLDFKSYITLVPINRSHRFFNQGKGVVVWFESDTQLNNSFEKSIAYLRDKCFIQGVNNSGSTILKNQLVRQSGFDITAQLPTVALADATIAANAVVMGVAMEDFDDGEKGALLLNGSYQENTSAFSLGDQVFLSNTPGSISMSAGTVPLVVGRICDVDTEGAISISSSLTGGIGIQGTQGETGLQGLDGPQGGTGIQGVTGIAAAAGSSINVAITWPGDYTPDVMPKIVPLFPWSAPSKLSDPASLPTGFGLDTAWSPNGEFLAVAHSTSPFLTIYQRYGNSLVKIANPGTLPTGTGNGVAWSSNGEYLAVAHATSPFVTIYQRDGVTFTKLANPITLPPADANSVAWSPNGEFLVIGHFTTPFVTIYQRTSSTVFTKIANPSLPPNFVTKTAWSPNGEFLSMAHASSPYISIYQRIGLTSFAKLPNPANLPTGNGAGTAWSPDGKFLSVAHAITPFITIYERTGTTFTKVANPATLPPGNNGNSGNWSPDGNFLVVGHTMAPYFTIYSRSGSTFTKIADPASLPVSNVNYAVWSPNGEYLTAVTGSSPYVATWQTASNMPEGNLNFIGNLRQGT